MINNQQEALQSAGSDRLSGNYFERESQYLKLLRETCQLIRQSQTINDISRALIRAGRRDRSIIEDYTDGRIEAIPFEFGDILEAWSFPPIKGMISRDRYARAICEFGLYDIFTDLETSRTDSLFPLSNPLETSRRWVTLQASKRYHRESVDPNSKTLHIGQGRHGIQFAYFTPMSEASLRDMLDSERNILQFCDEANQLRQL